MKIAMVLDEEFPPDPRVENEARALIDAGHIVYLFCIDYSDRLKYEVYNNIHVFRYKVPGITFNISSLAYEFPFYKWILKNKLRNFFSMAEFQIIHVHDMRIAKIVHSIIQKKKITTVLDLHENRPEIMKFYDHVARFPGNILIHPAIWKKWEKKLTYAFDYVVVVTNEAKDYLHSGYNLPNEKIIVFPNTVHPAFYKQYNIIKPIEERLKNRYVVFYLGDTGNRRGLKTAIQGIGLVKDKIPEVLLVIAGKSKYDDKLKLLTGQHDLNQFISFEGYRNMKEIPTYLLNSNVCISPLHRNIHHDTTYANKLFQYMAFGVPVLVSNCIAQKNIVEKAEAGLIHQAENADDFAHKLLELYNNKENARNMGENGKQFIREEFNQTVTSIPLVNLYNRLKNKTIQ